MVDYLNISIMFPFNFPGKDIPGKLYQLIINYTPLSKQKSSPDEERKFR